MMKKEMELFIRVSFWDWNGVNAVINETSYSTASAGEVP